MGFYMSKIWSAAGKAEMKIVIVGLNNAGKTTLLYKLALGNVIVTEPTIGSNVESLQHKGLSFQVWDIGGQTNLRHSWEAYYQKTQAVIYVIDASDMNQENIQQSKVEFHNMILNPDLANAVILVFANKADLPGSKDCGELIEQYGLAVASHEVHVVRSSALTGAGLQEGLDWVADRLQKK